MATVNSWVGETVFSCLPLDHPDLTDFTIRVKWLSDPNLYAVIWRGFYYLSTAGNWNAQPEPMNRRHHRFVYPEACKLAVEHAPKLRLGPFGLDRDLYYTVEDALNGGFPAYQERILNQHRQVIR